MFSCNVDVSCAQKRPTTLCCACLNADRKLKPVKLIKKYYLWREVDFNIEVDVICWECEALLKKIWRFKNQVMKAQAVLRCDMKDLNMSCLSNLGYKTINDYDLYNNYVEKEEPQEYFEFNDCAETNRDDFTDHDFKENCLNFTTDNEEDTKPLFMEITKFEPVKVEDVLPKKERKKKVKKRVKSIEKNSRVEGKFAVKIMSEEEMLEARDKNRMITWYKGSPFKCEMCILGYRDKEKYDKHLDSKHSDKCGKYICNICAVRFFDKKHLAVHCESHYKHYHCKLCPSSHHQLKVMVRHYLKEHENKKYMCKVCQSEFSTWRALRYHRDMRHKENPKCEECGKAFPNETNLKRHLVLHTDIPMYKCGVCHKSYKGEWGLKSHMRFHDNTTATEDAYCAECDLQFKNVFLYKSHLKKNSKHITPDFKKHVCPECGKRFLEKVFLKRHYDSVHLKKKEHVCHICCKMYVKEYSLRQHIKLIHEGKTRPRNKVCEICDKRFTCKAFLKQHLNSHTGDRPYQCAQCSATFGYASALYMHTKLIHLKLKRGEKRQEAASTGEVHT